MNFPFRNDLYTALEWAKKVAKVAGVMETKTMKVEGMALIRSLRSHFLSNNVDTLIPLRHLRNVRCLPKRNGLCKSEVVVAVVAAARAAAA